MSDDPRTVIMQPTRGIARYMVFLPDDAGAREIGFVTHRTTGEWDFQRRDKSTCRLAYKRRRDAIAALIAEFTS